MVVNSQGMVEMTMLKARRIVETTCIAQGIHIETLMSGKRTKTYSRIRGDLARELRAETTLSWSEIGGLIGRKSTPRTREYVKPSELST